MKIVFENPDKVSGRLTLTVAEEDYKEKVDKQLKDYRKKVNMPGFRPGMVPMGLVKKQVGPQVMADVLNHIIGEAAWNYLKENNIEILGEPLANTDDGPIDVVNGGPEFVFHFDLAISPEINVTLSAEDSIPYYNIVADDPLIDRQVEMFAQRSGQLVKAEVYEGNDILIGDLRELDAEGNTLEGGVTVSEARIMPSYISNEEQQALFNGSKLGDIITINPRQMYGDAEFAALLKMEKEEAEQHTGDFSYQITEISHHQPAPVDQKLFDAVFGEGVCEDEAAFRAKIAEGLGQQLKSDADNKFLMDVRAYVENIVGELSFADDILKRMMKANNPDKDDAFIEENYAGAIEQLKWQVIKEKIIRDTEVKIGDEDVKAVAMESARVMFAQYGMNSVPDEYIQEYAEKMLQDKKSANGLVERALDVKIIEALKNVVTLDVKTVTIDQFSKLFQEN